MVTRQQSSVAGEITPSEKWEERNVIWVETVKADTITFDERGGRIEFIGEGDDGTIVISGTDDRGEYRTLAISDVALLNTQSSEVDATATGVVTGTAVVAAMTGFLLFVFSSLAVHPND